MLAIEQLSPGTVIHWSVTDILKHGSCDLDFYEDSFYECSFCDSIHNTEEEYYIDCPDEYWYDNYVDSRATLWDCVLDMKRNDDHYGDVVDSIAANGFVRPVTAWYKLGELYFGDGHHRLAAAIDLGITTIPVEICLGMNIADDSGEWNASQPIMRSNSSRV